MIAVIMAGGTGSRFWPRSRRSEPKQFLPLVGEKTLLVETVERIEPLIPLEKILIVTGAAFVDRVKRDLPGIPAENILGEPVGRNTAPCIALAAACSEARWGAGEVMAVLPADHHIADGELFREHLRIAAEACRDDSVLVTIGIEPARPETGYGYLELGDVCQTARGREINRLKRFVEKPDRTTAESYVQAGNYLWNSGMFLWRVGAIRAALEQHIPELAAPMAEFRKADRAGLPAILERIYPGLPSLSIDYGVMEKAADVVALPGRFPWNDVGSWEAIGDLVPVDQAGNSVVGEHISVESRGCIVHSTGKPVATIGVEDLIIVETETALLVCPRDRAQDVRLIVDRLAEAGRDDLL